GLTTCFSIYSVGESRHDGTWIGRLPHRLAKDSPHIHQHHRGGDSLSRYVADDRDLRSTIEVDEVIVIPTDSACGDQLHRPAHAASRRRRVWQQIALNLRRHG